MNPLGFEHAEVERSIPERFRKVVDAFHDRPVVVGDRGALSYGELDRASSRVAQALLDVSRGQQEPVGLLCRQDSALLIGIVGILKAGMAFSVLASSAPQSQMVSLVNYLQGQVVLCDAENAALAAILAQNTQRRVIVIGRETDAYPALDPGLDIEPDRLASLTFTSGTTGEPKGVMRSHRLLVQRAWFDFHDQGLGTHDRVALVYSAAFSAASSVIFGALLNGAALCLYDIAGLGLAPFSSWLSSNQATCLQIPIEQYRQWLDTLAPQAFFSSLRQIAPAGRLLRQDFERARPHLQPECVLIGRLGSSETGIIACTTFPVQWSPVEEVLPVGFPVPEMELRIIDETGQMVATDEIGELLVRSRYLSSGYWRRPDLTGRVFTADPDLPEERWYHTGDLVRIRGDGSHKGMLEFHGRRDDRVKVRGHSVELAAVETALLAIDFISAATVTAPITADGERRLVAYVVPTGKPGPTARYLRLALAETLPAYMIPGAFIMLDALPLTANGKVDRSALPAPDSRRPDLDTPYIAPRSATEAQVTSIWSDLLGCHPVGIDDNFLDLGGHSLLAARILARTIQTFGVALPLRDFFEAPTPATLSAQIDLHLATAAGDAGIERLLAEVEAWSEREAALMLGKANG